MRISARALSEVGTGELAPSSALGGHATAAPQPNDGRDGSGDTKGEHGPAKSSHGGASWNRTSDLILIRDAL